LQDGEVLEEHGVQVPYELKEAVSGEVVLVKATLRLVTPPRAGLKAWLPLLDPGLELLLEGVRGLVDRAGQEVVARCPREASDDAYKLPQ
jgi:hypothetical protein